MADVVELAKEELTEIDINEEDEEGLHFKNHQHNNLYYMKLNKIFE